MTTALSTGDHTSISIAMSNMHQSEISATFSIDVYMDRQSDQGLHGTDG